MLLTVIEILAVLIVFLAIFLWIRTLAFKRQSPTIRIPFESELPALNQGPNIFADHLSSVIKIETVSHEDEAEDIKENFNILQTLLVELYPLTHHLLKKEMIDGHTLLYTWQGLKPDLEPVVFMAHQDVVPADEHTLDQWTYPPFSGKIADGFIWGRGAMDIKEQLISVFEAVENLIRNSYRPERTIFLTFSHNEEVLGSGAKAVVDHLKKKGIRVHSVLDEGGSVYEGIIPGVKGQAATIGVAEKGYLSLKFRVNTTGGHSSTPAHTTAIGTLAKAIVKLERNRFPHHVELTKPLFQGLGSAASPIMQLAFANLWLFGGIIGRILTTKPEADATIRTTTAPTLFHSGVKDNVLPSLAEAVVNFRILPGETIQEVCEHIQTVINDERVKFEVMDQRAWEASPLSPVDCKAYQHLASVIQEVFPGSAVAPYIMLGGTDSRNFYAVSDKVYRFTPMVVKNEDLSRVHGVNERISVDALYSMVDTLYRLIPRWASTQM